MTNPPKVPESQLEGLRKRNVAIYAPSDEDARSAVLRLNALEETSAKREEDKKTFGRTPDGTGGLHFGATVVFFVDSTFTAWKDPLKG